MEFTPFFLSFKLAFVVSILLFLLCVPFAWFLFQTKNKIKPFLEALVALPLVLPPSVLGFYILVTFAPDSTVGRFLQNYFNLKLVFTFEGLIVASMIYSLPFMLQPIQNGFESLNKGMIEASYLSGKGKLTTLLRVALPNIKPSLVSAFIITFAHTVGEFGVVLMVGGNIPQETKVASVAIYEMVEVMDYESAHIYSALLLGLSFCVLLFVYIFQARHKQDVRVGL